MAATANFQRKRTGTTGAKSLDLLHLAFALETSDRWYFSPSFTLSRRPQAVDGRPVYNRVESEPASSHPNIFIHALA